MSKAVVDIDELSFLTSKVSVIEAFSKAIFCLLQHSKNGEQEASSLTFLLEDYVKAIGKEFEIFIKSAKELE